MSKRNLPRIPGFRQGCHANHICATLADITVKISQRAAKADMIIDQEIRGATDDLAGENRRCHQPMPALGSRMTNLIRLHHRTRGYFQAKLSGQGLRHRVGNRVKAGNLIRGHRQQADWNAADELPNPRRLLRREQILDEPLRRLGVAGLRSQVSRMAITPF